MLKNNGKSDPMKDMKDLAAMLQPLATLTATYYNQLVAEGVPRGDALKLAQSLIETMMSHAQQRPIPTVSPVDFVRAAADLDDPDA